MNVKLYSLKNIWRVEMMRILIYYLIFIFFFSINSFADVVFEMEQEQQNSSEVNKTVGSIKGKNIKMDFITGGATPESSMIYIGDKKEMVTISHKDKSYFVMDEPTMNKLAGQMNQAMAQMKETMKEMSPQERAMMEKMMKGKMPNIGEKSYVEPVIKQAGSGDVNGYPCIKYDVYIGSEKVREHCVTKWESIEGGDEMRGAMLKMAEFMHQMTKAYSKGPFGSKIQFERSMFNQLKKMNGFPVHTIDYENGAPEYESTFKSSKITSVDTSTFEPPVGYKKQNMDIK